MNKKLKIGERPGYFDGQLLQADDFIAEQLYHRKARQRHVLALFGWGVANGLEVKATSATTLTVQPGFAIDARGHEFEIDQAFTLDVTEFAPLAKLRVSIEYRDDPEPEREHRNRIDSHAYAMVTDGADDRDAVLLAKLTLDGSGKIDAASIDTSGVRHLQTKLAPGSVTVASLADTMRVGWLRLPFHGWPLEKSQQMPNPPPPFLQGSTEARSHKNWNDVDNTAGAAGTMSIPIPFGAMRVSKLRLAGMHNSKHVDVHLLRGGFDPVAKAHVREILAERKIEGHPFDVTLPIENGQLDPLGSTLALWVRGWGHTSISLVALEFHLDGS